MLYYKPKNLTYSQLCIWIDNNAYKEDCDEYTLFQYLYLIIDLLSKKNKYFRNYRDYEQFSIFAATRIFFRIRRPKRKNSQKINYILSYLQKSLNFIKIDYQNKEFGEKTLPVESYEQLISFNDLFNSLSDELYLVDFRCCLHDLTNTICAFFNQLPRQKYNSEWYNIKLSVLLSFLYELKYSIRKEIIINLEDTYKPLIAVLLRELKLTISNDLKDILSNVTTRKSSDLLEVVYSVQGEDNERNKRTT